MFDRQLRTAAAALAMGVLASCASLAPADYEIWALDQGTHVIHIYDSSLKETAKIDLGATGVRNPHMVDFTQDHSYAFVASTGSGDVTVIRAKDRAIVANLKTGPNTHMAAVRPDDKAVIVDVIGDPKIARDGKFVEIVVDKAGGNFKLGRSLVVADDPVFKALGARFNDSNPICHAYAAGGRLAYATLGPGLKDGGLVVLDTENFRLTHAIPPDELPVNCGTYLMPDRKHMMLNGGSGDVGKWYVVDTTTNKVVNSGDSGGKDAHGVWGTVDGREIWMVNRVSSNGIVLDAKTLNVVAKLDEVGPTPDIMAMSPDGKYAFVTTRGPKPISAPHVAKGTTPGFAVIGVADRKLVRIVQPAAGNESSDFHGIAVRVIR